MAKKRAFVKYTKQGKLIPGSLIVTTSGGYPTNGLYYEVPVDLCCPTEPVVSLYKFDTSTTGLGGKCVGKGTAITIYLTQECYDNIILPASVIGCEVWSDAAGTIPASNADYLVTIEGNKPGYITVVNGLITVRDGCI